MSLVTEASRLWGTAFDATDYGALEKAKAAVTSTFPESEQQTILSLSCLNQHAQEHDKGLSACRGHNTRLVQCMVKTYCPQELQGFVDCVHAVAPQTVADVTLAPRASQSAFDRLDQCMLGHVMDSVVITTSSCSGSSVVPQEACDPLDGTLH